MQNSAIKYIEASGLNKHYGNIHAVKDLDLAVRQGSVCGFLGPNGAGKSTTIRMLLTLVKPSSGEIRIFSKSVIEHRKEILKRTGALVEKPDFYLNLSAYKNLELLARYSGTGKSRATIMETLEKVGLSHRHHSPVKTFSQGMKQRLGLAQAILHDPDLLILDEPSNGLDPQGIKEMRELIIELNREKGKTILISSHLLHEVEMIADSMIVINEGRAVAAGSVKELLGKDDLKVTIKTPDTEAAKKVIAESAFASAIKLSHGTGKADESSHPDLVLNLREDQVHEVNALLVRNGIKVLSLIPVRSLEEYFLKITSGKKPA